MNKRYAATSLIAVVTAAALPVLQHYENTPLESYPDAGKVWTICSGVTRIPGVGPVRPGMKLTTAQCADLDGAVASGFTSGVAQRIKVLVPVASMTAHVTFAYNIGLSGYGKSEVLRLTNTGQYEAGCRAMMNWHSAGGKDCRIRANGCPGLINRRNEEIKQCLDGWHDTEESREPAPLSAWQQALLWLGK